MRKFIFLTFFFATLFHAKSQDKEVEVYFSETHTILKGRIIAGSSDSIRIRVDSLHTLAFAKTELEGRDLPISKRGRKIRRALFMSELGLGVGAGIGSYQIAHQQTRGKIMKGMVIVGVAVMAASGVYLVVGLATANGVLDGLGACVGAFLVFMPGLLTLQMTQIWSHIDKFYQLRSIAFNRYYCIK